MTNIVLVYGGCGALGRQCVETFKERHFKVVSVDLAVNAAADFNIAVDPTRSLGEQKNQVVASLDELDLRQKINAILCVAGGWAGGSAKDDDMVENVFILEKQSIWSSVICAHLAAHFLTENGCLVLTGASAALGPTPGMLGYGMVKAAVHQLTKSLAEDRSLPNNSLVVAILPIILKTEANRRSMPDADISSWTPLEFVANLLLGWVSGDSDKPASGSLVQIITANHETTTKIV